MTAKKSKIIAVIGGRNPSEAKLAEEVGKELARQGAILICGGLSGVMQAACEGAQSQGGITIGVLPGNDATTANPYVRIPIVTNLGYARNIIVVKSARAVIAIGGGYGTLTEIGYALDAKIPVIGLQTWSLSRNHQVDKSIVRARSAKEAIQKALELTEAK
jgi:hypothetical protein